MKEPHVRVMGPLAIYADGFAVELKAQGYTKPSAANQLRLLADLSRWLGNRRLTPAELTPERATKFLASRRRRGYVCWLSPRALAPTLGYLHRIEAVPIPSVARTPLDDLLEEYRHYLAVERALAAGTIRGYVDTARSFLSRPGRGNELDLNGLAAADVIDFVLVACSARSPKTANNVVTGLRSLLRFLYLTERTAAPLASAVPGVAGWRAGALPQTVGAGQVARLLASCDRRSRGGCRDFALLTLLARLGLRVGEVAALRLDDIDWRSGEIVIRGKGGRTDRLPLPVDVGEALAAYLRRRRRRAGHRQLFLTVRAPDGGLSSTAIRAVVRRAWKRAGMPDLGAHRLRHSAATEMLSNGAQLSDIGQVLRHRDLVTTAIYAKVDRAALMAVAQPWPGVSA
jgi:site-specific recombinase XerD